MTPPAAKAPKRAPKRATAVKKPKVVSDLTPDQVDAVLRDPNAPGAVRAARVNRDAIERVREEQREVKEKLLKDSTRRDRRDTDK